MVTSRMERGFALAGAVFALVVIAVLVTGAFFVARQESSIGKNSATYERAFQAAEAGLNRAISEWQDSITTYNGLANGDSVAISGTLSSSGGSYAGYIRRLTDELFIVRVTGTDPTGTSSRTLASMLKLNKVDMEFRAGLTTRNSLTIGGSSFIDGNDGNPSGWGCDATSTALPGILAKDTTQIDFSGCTNMSCVEGDPKIAQDTSISDSTFFAFGDTDWAELVAMATKTYPIGTINLSNTVGPVGTTTTCTRSVLDNWGEPSRPPSVAGCSTYFPIVYVPENLKITGGRGQGILLVGGDLEVQGGFEFYGPVIVRGRLKTAGQGGHFNGGVMAANVDLEVSSVLGDAVITYSSCAIERSLQANAPGRLLPSRSWVELVQ
jgi:hypothetical protein